MSSEPQQSVRTVASWVREWPQWVLVVCFIALAVVFALAGKLDDWVRIAACIIFLAIAICLLARWREHREG